MFHCGGLRLKVERKENTTRDLATKAKYILRCCCRQRAPQGWVVWHPWGMTSQRRVVTSKEGGGDIHGQSLQVRRGWHFPVGWHTSVGWQVRVGWHISGVDIGGGGVTSLVEYYFPLKAAKVWKLDYFLSLKSLEERACFYLAKLRTVAEEYKKTRQNFEGVVFGIIDHYLPIVTVIFSVWSLYSLWSHQYFSPRWPEFWEVFVLNCQCSEKKVNIRQWSMPITEETYQW